MLLAVFNGLLRCAILPLFCLLSNAVLRLQYGVYNMAYIKAAAYNSAYSNIIAVADSD